MAAPTLQAEGALEAITTGNLTVALPAHQTDDILIIATALWAPNSTTVEPIAAPSGWSEIIQLEYFDISIDGQFAYFWKRAASSSESNPVFVRPASADTGVDTCWGGRAYVIRGCAPVGEPWDDFDPTIVLWDANQPVEPLTVMGTERLAIHFLVKTNDFVTAPTVSGWTAGTQVESTTGTDHSQGSFRKDNVSANTAADASTVEALDPGGYVFLGITFKPITADSGRISAGGSDLIETSIEKDSGGIVTKVVVRNSDTRNWLLTLQTASQADLEITAVASEETTNTPSPVYKTDGELGAGIQLRVS